MAGRTSLTLTVMVFVLFVSSFVADGVLGGRTKIGDVNTNQEVQELGRYSVDEYNQLQRSQKGGSKSGDLKFSKVVEAEKQVVSGTKYYLKIKAFSTSGVSKIFDAEVVVKPWIPSKQLLKFTPSPAAK